MRYLQIKKETEPRLCNFSGESTNTTKEIFFGGVFLSAVALQSLPPRGRGTAIAVEGACVTLEF